MQLVWIDRKGTHTYVVGSVAYAITLIEALTIKYSRDKTQGWACYHLEVFTGVDTNDGWESFETVEGNKVEDLIVYMDQRYQVDLSNKDEVSKWLKSQKVKSNFEVRIY